MGPLGAPTRSSCLAVLGAALALGALAAGARLLPWLLDARVSWGVVAVFARGLAVVTLEAATVVALPVGFALAAARASDGGDARACLLVGASPWGLTLRTAPFAAAMATLSLLVGLAWGGARAEPSRVLSELSRAARATCGPERPVAEIPGGESAWLCAPSQPPRVAMVSGAAVVVAEGVAFAPRELQLGEASLTLRGPPELRVRVREASIVGFPAFEAPAGIAGSWRGLSLLVGAVLSALAVMASLLEAGESRRAVAAALGVFSGAAPLVLAGAMQRGGMGMRSSLVLLALPPVALAPAALHALWRSTRARHERHELRALRGEGRGGTTSESHGTHRPG